MRRNQNITRFTSGWSGSRSWASSRSPTARGSVFRSSSSGGSGRGREPFKIIFQIPKLSNTGMEQCRNVTVTVNELAPVLWIRIQSGTVFNNFVDLDPYFVYWSGTMQVKIGEIQIRGTRCKIEDENSTFRDPTVLKFYLCHYFLIVC